LAGKNVKYWMKQVNSLWVKKNTWELVGELEVRSSEGFISQWGIAGDRCQHRSTYWLTFPKAAKAGSDMVKIRQVVGTVWCTWITLMRIFI